MGFGDKLKELREQAQQAVAENKDRIQDAVQVVGDAANTRTGGKYANKIGKVGMKVEQGIDRFAEGAPAAEPASSAPIADDPDEPDESATPPAPPAADTAGGGFPDFE